MKKIINSNHAAQPIGPYNQAISFGNLFFTSGQIAITAEGEFLNDNIETETRQVFKNLNSLLKEENLSFKNVIKASIFLKDMSDFNTVNAIYSEYFQKDFAPARETVEVSNLPKGARIEISLIAGK